MHLFTVRYRVRLNTRLGIGLKLFKNSIIQIEISSLALSKHVEIQPEPFSSIERDLWRYALRVNQSIRRFQSLSIEENFQSSALRNELQTLENTPDCINDVLQYFVGQNPILANHGNKIQKFGYHSASLTEIKVKIVQNC